CSPRRSRTYDDYSHDGVVNHGRAACGKCSAG
ncbi:MAG: hypothetical protein ACI97B_000928, partial [Verrucomicrobiales bacterium]